MATQLYIQTVSENDIAGNAKSLEAGVLTFTEYRIYLGIGGKKVQYGGSGTVAKGNLSYIGDFTSDDDAKNVGTTNALFYNSTEGALKIYDDNLNIETIIKGGVSLADLTRVQDQLTAQINNKAEANDVYTKNEVNTKAEVTQAIEASKTAIEGIITTRVNDEKDRAELAEQALQTLVEGKSKSVSHRAGIEMHLNDFVVHANKIYLVTQPFTTTADFAADEANLFDLSKSMGNALPVVEYQDNNQIEIKSGQQVLKDGKLYVCKVDIAQTTTWDVDSQNMIDAGANLDLTDYYNKAAVDGLLALKMNVVTPGDGVKVTQNVDNVTLSADMTTDATAEKIAQRDAEGALFAKMPTVLSDDAVINYGAFKLTEQKIKDNEANINKLMTKYEGKVDEYFTMPKQTLVIGAEGVKKALNFDTNIPLNNITVTWDKPDKILLDLENKQFNSILAPVEADYPIKAELTKSSSGKVLVELIFNYKEDGAQSTTSDYTLKDYVTVTLMRDNSKMETNPEGAFTWLDDAVGMTQAQIMEFLGLTPMVLDEFGGEITKLNPDNYAQTKDGRAANRPLGNDTMIKAPIRGIKRWTNGAVSFLSITDNPDAEAQGYIYTTFYYGNKKLTEFYVGAYEGYVHSTKLYSCHDQNVAVNTTLTNFRKYAKARGKGFQLVDGYMIDYIQACYLMVHKSANSQKTVGAGISSGAAKKTGLADTYGMNNENSPDKTSTTNPIKCLGIENLWGNVWTWVDGMYIDNLYRIKKTNNPDIFNDTGAGYDILGVGLAQGNSQGKVGFVSDVAWDDKLGFYPTSVQNGADTKFYCDGLWQLTDRCALFGGCYATGSDAGVFCWSLNNAASSVYGSFGGRLAFKRI